MAPLIVMIVAWVVFRLTGAHRCYRLLVSVLHQASAYALIALLVARSEIPVA